MVNDLYAHPDDNDEIAHEDVDLSGNPLDELEDIDILPADVDNSQPPS